MLAAEREHGLGGEPQGHLRRRLGLGSAISITVGAVIGSGIFLKPLVVAKSLPGEGWILGLWIALGYRWGSAWYTHVVVPYLHSVIFLRPNIAAMADLPLVARLHVLGAFALITVFSFTRLVHMLVAPLPYIWRRVQVVMWYRPRGHRGVLRNPT